MLKLLTEEAKKHSELVRFANKRNMVPWKTMEAVSLGWPKKPIMDLENII